MLRFMVHYGIHFLVPVTIALLLFKDKRKIVMIILLAGIVIDIDHLFANPVYDPSRCSINFHFLHSYLAIAIYGVLFLVKKTRIFGLALLIHILADLVDCWMLGLE